MVREGRLHCASLSAHLAPKLLEKAAQRLKAGRVTGVKHQHDALMQVRLSVANDSDARQKTPGKNAESGAAPT